jgi:uncharacterized protein
VQFIEQYRKGQETFASYLLTAIFVFMGLLIGNIVSAILAIAIQPGLLNAPDKDPLAAFDSTTQLIFMMMPFVFALLGLMLSIKYVHHRPILSLFTSRPAFDWKRYFFAFAVWGIILCIFLAISSATTSRIQWNFNGSTFVMLFAVSLILFPIQTAVEEAFFRGWLLQGVGKLFKHAGLTILLSGIFFGLLHGANPEVEKIGYGLFAYYIFSGIFLGIIAHLDDGLELGMGYHAANNFFAAVVLTNDWQAFQSDAIFMDTAPPSFGWDAILTLVLLQPALLLLFGKVYKWKNWRGRLSQKWITEESNLNEDESIL